MIEECVIGGFSDNWKILKRSKKLSKNSIMSRQTMKRRIIWDLENACLWKQEVCTFLSWVSFFPCLRKRIVWTLVLLDSIAERHDAATLCADTRHCGDMRRGPTMTSGWRKIPSRGRWLLTAPPEQVWFCSAYCAELLVLIELLENRFQANLAK